MPYPTTDLAAARMRRAIPDGPDDRANHPVYAAFEADADIPEAGIRAGDLVLHLSYLPMNGRQQRGIRFPLVPVPRAAFGAVIRALDDGTLRPVEAADRVGGTDEEEVREIARAWLARSGGGRRARTAKLETSPLRIVRDLWEPASAPVEAASDDGALFELLAQLGCRMPA